MEMEAKEPSEMEEETQEEKDFEFDASCLSRLIDDDRGYQSMEDDARLDYSSPTRCVYETDFSTSKLVACKDGTRIPTYAAVSHLLQVAGMQTHYKEALYGPKDVPAESAEEEDSMVKVNNACLVRTSYISPLEFVARRYASSSYATKNPMVREGTRFDDVIVDYYYNKKFEKTYEEEDESRYMEPEKQIDDGQDKEEDIKQLTREQVLDIVRKTYENDENTDVDNDDPNSNCWWGEELYVKMSPFDLDQITERVRACFEILEKAWATQECALVDLKIRVGVQKSRRSDEPPFIFSVDFIDNYTWNLWPASDKRLKERRQKDCSLTLDMITNKWVMEKSQHFIVKPPTHAQVVILISKTDQSELRYDDDEDSDEAQLQALLRKFYIQSDIRVVRNIEKIKNVIKSYDSQWSPVVFIVFGHEFGQVVSKNVCGPVINYIPQANNDKNPSGVGCRSIREAVDAALRILSVGNITTWARVRMEQLREFIEDSEKASKYHEKMMDGEKFVPPSVKSVNDYDRFPFV